MIAFYLFVPFFKFKNKIHKPMQEENKTNETSPLEPKKKPFSMRPLLAFVIVLLLCFAAYYMGREQLFPDTKNDGNSSGQVSSDEAHTHEQGEEEEAEAAAIEYEVSKHQKKFFKNMFKDCNKSKRILVKACNYKEALVRNYAVQIAGKHPGNFNIGQVCDIFDHCYKNWKYVNDPSTVEYISKASETIENDLNGDCDDFAVLMCSLILSVGGEARVNYAWGPDGGHAFTEVNLGDIEDETVLKYIKDRYVSLYFYGNDLNARRDKQGNIWLNLDWFAENPGGEYFDFDIGYTFYILQNFCEDIIIPNGNESAEGS
jgi:hypothetical protein